MSESEYAVDSQIRNDFEWQQADAEMQHAHIGSLNWGMHPECVPPELCNSPSMQMRNPCTSPDSLCSHCQHSPHRWWRLGFSRSTRLG